MKVSMIKSDLINILYKYTSETKIIRPIIDVADAYEVLLMSAHYHNLLKNKNNELAIIDELNSLNFSEINEEYIIKVDNNLE